jgi:hypothetical protein
MQSIRATSQKRFTVTGCEKLDTIVKNWRSVAETQANTYYASKKRVNHLRGIDFTMVKQSIAGINVPAVATSAQLRVFVHKVFLKLHENCSITADALGVTPATIWKLENDKQNDSQVLRDSLEIKKVPDRPREWMPTNNLTAAMKKMREHYTGREIFLELTGVDPTTYVMWHGTGEPATREDMFEGIREQVGKLERGEELLQPVE